MRQRHVAYAFAALATALCCSPAGADDTRPAEPDTVPARAVGQTHDCISYFPVRAVRRNETGSIFFNYDVGADGTIRNVTFKEKSGFDDLDAAAMACVTQKWRETPATRDGIAIESPGHIAIVTFTLNGGDAQTFYREGMQAIHAEYYSMAVYAFTNALDRDPNFKDAYAQRGLAYDHMYDREHALADYAKAGVPPLPPIAPPPNGPSFAIGETHDCRDHFPLLSAQLFENGQVHLQYDVGADGVIGNVVLLKSSGVERLDQAALACVRERWRNVPAQLNGVGIPSPGHKATVVFDGGTPRSATQFYMRGRARSSLSDYANAIADFDQALVLDPLLADVHYARADAYEALGQHDSAEADRLKAKELTEPH